MFRKLVKLIVAHAALLLGLTGINTAMADPIPVANCPINCLTFGDFKVFSLALLNMQATGNTANPGPGDPFYVKSTPGELASPGYIVYGTGTNNNGAVTNGANMDNAFDTSASGSTNSKFSTLTATEPIPTFTGDIVNSWDAQTSAIRNTLGNSQFNIFFNLNETGNDNLAGIDLLIWVKATVCQAGEVNCVSFYLKGGPLELGGPAVDNALPVNPTDADVTNQNLAGIDPRWTYVHGSICAGPSGTFLHNGPCTGADPATSKTLNQNLGENQAAFAIFNQTLNDDIMNAALGYTTLHVTWLMSAEDNGYEQGFSSNLQPGTFLTPEPDSVFLAGIALLALALVRRRHAAQRTAPAYSQL